jgi:hypothetical protein
MDISVSLPTSYPESNSFMPLSRGGLCEAVIMAPGIEQIEEA